ncbi:MAG TPA: DUF3108 domain-containing protein [Thermoanaerobaculia bacterium]|jgi:hypothetical protein|nr:DUF3108 domain-containing protein [Thermoanaerobaculia bacterium]
MSSILRKSLLLGLLALLVAGPWTSTVSAQATPGRGNEEFQYHWQLRNILGTLAGLFLPNRGDGYLTFKTDGNGHLRSELTITSNVAKQGEYFRYGSEVDTRTLQPIRAWSAYSWRGETKSKSEDITADGVLDIASGIYAIRRDPPQKPRRMEIWSDGKVYPVIVVPQGLETRTLQDGKKVQVQKFSIRGVDMPDRDRWKGRLDLWLARDDAATPVEILISRNLADVRMELKSLR